VYPYIISLLPWVCHGAYTKSFVSYSMPFHFASWKWGYVSTPEHWFWLSGIRESWIGGNLFGECRCLKIVWLMDLTKAWLILKPRLAEIPSDFSMLNCRRGRIIYFNYCLSFKFLCYEAVQLYSSQQICTLYDKTHFPKYPKYPLC
jgi:hypothetical protein